VTQVTLRLPDDLAGRLKEAARQRGQSLNSWAALVLTAAVDPDLAGDPATRLRERLARAGVLAVLESGGRARPDPARLARARAAAAQGHSLSDLVSEGRA
jgi:uncharacterized protein (DUF1778 family)